MAGLKPASKGNPMTNTTPTDQPKNPLGLTDEQLAAAQTDANLRARAVLALRAAGFTSAELALLGIL